MTDLRLDTADRWTALPADQRPSALIRSLADMFGLVPRHAPGDLERFEMLFRPLYREACDADRLYAAEHLARRRDLPPTVVDDMLCDEREISLAFQAARIRAFDSEAATAPHPSGDGDGGPLPDEFVAELDAPLGAPPPPDLSVLNGFLALNDDQRLQKILASIAEISFRLPQAGPPPRPRLPETLLDRLTERDRAGAAVDLAMALGKHASFGAALIEDPGGEALAVALAALGADNADAVSILLWVLPDETRSYWRMATLRQLHARMGVRAAQILIDRWAPDETERRVTAMRQTMDAMRAAVPAARPAAAATVAVDRRSA